jgi:hypothetical protein
MWWVHLHWWDRGSLGGASSYISLSLFMTL